ncbi:MAG: dCMP deaminase family protein [Candidatus Diapherotrites archaeon]|nr:dCMP deaminase family protein [Candidatus Diapherotrites archaeon]
MSFRPSKDEYYLEIAKSIGLRSPCMRKKFGAIIVRHDTVVSTGYNGPPRGGVNCFDIGCVRDELDMEHYAAYDATCPAVHAEENCIVNAARNGTKVLGGVLYIQGVSPEDNSLVESRPCHRCRRALINAGVTEVITRDTEGQILRYNVGEWTKTDTETYIKKYKEATAGK